MQSVRAGNDDRWNRVDSNRATLFRTVSLHPEHNELPCAADRCRLLTCCSVETN